MAESVDITPPSGIVEVLHGLLNSIIANPIHALLNANYIGILAWAVGLGIALRHAADTTKALINDMSDAVTLVVRVVIRFAPLGILVWSRPLSQLPASVPYSFMRNC